MIDQREWWCKRCDRRFVVSIKQIPVSCPFCGSSKLRAGTTTKAMPLVGRETMGTIAEYLAQAGRVDPRRGRPF